MIRNSESAARCLGTERLPARLFRERADDISVMVQSLMRKAELSELRTSCRPDRPMPRWKAMPRWPKYRCRTSISFVISHPTHEGTCVFVLRWHSFPQNSKPFKIDRLLSRPWWRQLRDRLTIACNLNRLALGDAVNQFAEFFFCFRQSDRSHRDLLINLCKYTSEAPFPQSMPDRA